MVIASHVEGRLRVRDPRLRQPRVLYALREKLLLRPDVREVSCNPKVGSLLVLYRSLRNSFREISSLLGEFLGRAVPSAPKAAPAPKTSPRCRPLLSRRRVVNFGMLASLLASLIASAGSTQLHILAGLIFLGILGVHLFDKRATLLA